MSPNAKNKDLLMNKKSKKLFYFTLLYQPLSVDFSISFKIDINCVINMRDSQRELLERRTKWTTKNEVARYAIWLLAGIDSGLTDKRLCLLI